MILLAITSNLLIQLLVAVVVILVLGYALKVLLRNFVTNTDIQNIVLLLFAVVHLSTLQISLEYFSVAWKKTKSILTLKEQVDHLKRIAGNEYVNDCDRRILLQCSATIFDFYMDARQEIMEELEDDRIKTVSSIRKDFVPLNGKHTLQHTPHKNRV